MLSIQEWNTGEPSYPVTKFDSNSKIAKKQKKVLHSFNSQHCKNPMITPEPVSLIFLAPQ